MLYLIYWLSALYFIPVIVSVSLLYLLARCKINPGKGLYNDIYCAFIPALNIIYLIAVIFSSVDYGCKKLSDHLIKLSQRP